MNACHKTIRSGFTLVELLIVIMIIAILASITLFTLQGVQENARDARTRAQIARLHDLIMARLEEFKTRPMPIKVPAGSNAAFAARLRVDSVRSMMRLELPDRMTDVLIPNPSGPGFVPAANDMPQLAWPSLAKQYWTKATGARVVPATSNWSEEHESAECLYLIVAAMNDGDASALEFFSESEIGDVDGDGMREILDAWGNPIHFLRWAPGFGADFSTATAPYTPIPFYASPLQPLSDRDPANLGVGDPFDPLRVYPNPPGDKHFPLYPLIFSSGADEQYGVMMYPFLNFIYSSTASPTTPINDPYHVPAAPTFPIGTPVPDANGNLPYADNIHNHFSNVR